MVAATSSSRRSRQPIMAKYYEHPATKLYRRERNPATGSAASQSPNRPHPGDLLSSEPPTKPAASSSFAAMKSRPYRAQFIASVLAMMADNIEHVISYWVVFQKFHSPALAGFAVLSHWLPFLLFSVAVGGLADRVDPRRIIQCGMLLFIVASAGWGFFFITDTIEMWHAMLLLVIHGCAGVLWQTPNQLLLYDLVGPADLPSAVRLNAMARYLGILVGPAVGGIIMLTLGTSHGIIFNTLFYLPMLLWLFWAPVRDKSVAVRRFAVRGLADIMLT